ncbi:MAG: hypothetical protein HQ581_17805, partial [Planctomycetes bacterium]|nr:hypothetical protein [Planctomycetota bacterium]
MPAHDRLRTLVVPAVAAAVIAVAAEVSFAQVGYTLASLEWLAADADVVVRGSIVDVSRDPPDGQWVWLTVTLKVDETLKGEHAPRVKFAVRTLTADERYQQWKDSGQQQMWFLAGTNDAMKPYGGGGWSMIRLGPAVPGEAIFSRFPPPIMTMDLSVLEEPDEILKAARAAVRDGRQRKRARRHSIWLPRAVAQRTGRSGDVNRLIVPRWDDAKPEDP